MIDGYINIARKLSKEFDIVLAKQLFSSVVVKGFDVHLIISLGGNVNKIIPKHEIRYHSFDKQITHIFKDKTLCLILHIS